MIDPSQAKLPVMVWIYGGGLETGDTLYNNATYMIEHSVEKVLLFHPYSLRLFADSFVRSTGHACSHRIVQLSARAHGLPRFFRP